MYRTIWRAVTAQWCQQANVHKERGAGLFLNTGFVEIITFMQVVCHTVGHVVNTKNSTQIVLNAVLKRYLPLRRHPPSSQRFRFGYFFLTLQDDTVLSLGKILSKQSPQNIRNTISKYLI